MRTKAGRVVTVSFVVASALMIAAAIGSAFFGYYLLLTYKGSMAYYHTSTDYRALYLGILNLVAFGLDLFAAMLLLLRKHIKIATALTGTVLTFGLATPFISNFLNHSYALNGTFGATIETVTTVGLQGLFLGSAMIAFSIPSLILIRLNYKKIKRAAVIQELKV